MRNDITPDHCALSTTTVETRHISINANNHRLLEMVRDDRRRDGVGASGRVPSVSVSPTSDFEGFGSFS